MKKIVSVLKEIVYTVVISFLIAFFLATFVVKPTHVVGSSMYPTLHDKDIGFSGVITTYLGGYDRFDIVVIQKDNSDDLIVKRIIGLPNETISYQNDCLYINGEYIEEPFLDKSYKQSQSQGRLFTSNIESITLKENEYFVLGDNRPYSSDSRVYGVFHKEQFLSKGFFVIFPFYRFGPK